jgi:anti-sigma factor RsiW
VIVRRARHLQEDRLFDAYVAERQGELMDPRVAEHLADCDACAARYAALTLCMDDLGTAAELDSDAVFTPERLRAQQQQIARRIEHVGRAARVLSFPHHFSGDHIHTSASHMPQRWVAAAAAAGLFVGAVLGVSYEWDRRASAARRFPAAAQQPATAYPAHLMPVATRGDEESQTLVAADDAFMSELELVLERPHTPELEPIDALTPHVREIVDLR